MTIAAYGRRLKDNRGLSTPKGQFSSRCQARLPDCTASLTHGYPPHYYPPNRQGLHPSLAY
jgi:hypothetical protein